MRQVWLSAAMLLAGTGLLVSAGRASERNGAKLRQGGTLRVNLPSADIDDIDPSLAYGSASWHIEYSTALKLLNYPDAPGPRGSRLVPEGAAGLSVSPNGRKYTFRIRKGFRFSDGTRVTARNYAFAINRALSRDLESPAFQFIADPLGTNIVGAQQVRDGSTDAASGVMARGSKLVVRLKHPDGAFLSKITMPFFQAMPNTLSRRNKVVQVDTIERLPSAGPYYVANRDPNRLVVLKKNPYYAVGVAVGYERCPSRLARIEIMTVTNESRSYQEVRSNEADYSYTLPRGVAEEIEEEFGLKGRFRVRPRNCIDYVALNSNSRLFHHNPRTASRR
jgi:peptide/nickel transport system substrate-binding protein